MGKFNKEILMSVNITTPVPTLLPCYDGGFVTYLLVQMIAFSNYAWYAVNGFALASPTPFIVYLSMVYWEEIFISYTLYGFFTVDFTPSQIAQLNVMCSADALSIPVPNLPVQLAFVLTIFTLVHALINFDRVITNKAIFAYIVLLDISIPFALFYTGNASITQIALAIGLAVFNSVRRAIIFEFLFNPFWLSFQREWHQKEEKKEDDKDIKRQLVEIFNANQYGNISQAHRSIFENIDLL